MDGAAIQKLNAVADQCPCSGYCVNTNAGCGTNCSNHHKNLLNISNQLWNEDREDEHLYVMWSYANQFCKDNSGHTEVAYCGIVWNYRQVVHIMYPAIDVENLEANMANYLLHEVMHTYGYSDVYDLPEHSSFNTSCAMGGLSGKDSKDFYAAVNANYQSFICEFCSNQLESHGYMTKYFYGN